MLHTVFRHELLPAEIFNFSNFESFVVFVALMNLLSQFLADYLLE